MGGSACRVPHRNTAVAFIHSSLEILPISCESSCHESNNGKAPSRGICAWLHNCSNPSAPMTSGLSSSANWENSAAARCSEYTSDFCPALRSAMRRCNQGRAKPQPLRGFSLHHCLGQQHQQSCLRLHSIRGSGNASGDVTTDKIKLRHGTTTGMCCQRGDDGKWKKGNRGATQRVRDRSKG